MGIPHANMPPPVANTSTFDPLLDAAKMPTVIPIKIVATKAEPRSITVMESRHDISTAMGVIVCKEKPKFHVNMFLTYFKYRMYIGFLSPQSSSSACLISSVNFGERP